VQVLPGLEVRRAEQVVGSQVPALRPEGSEPGRKGVIIGAALLPDAGIEHPIRQGRPVRRPERSDRTPRHLPPVQQQRVAGDRHHVPGAYAVVHGDHPLRLHQGGAGVAPLLRSGTDGIGKVRPADQVRADGVSQCWRGSSGGRAW